MDEILQSIFDSIVDGDRDSTQSGVVQALEKGLSPQQILNEGLIAAMTRVGQLFEEGEYYVPEMLIAARAMQSGLAELKPRLVASGVQSVGKVAIGTVKGDLHDIGKNLVAMMLEGAGFEIIDLGADVDPGKFIDAVRLQQVDIIGMSALLTTTMTNMKVTIDALKDAGLRDQVKVLVGGAPVTEAFASQIGADGYSPDASSAVRKAKELLQA